MIRIIATDIDRTLATGGKIPASAVAAAKEALAAGIKVVLASGRPLVGMQEYLDTLGIAGSEQYVITHNGGILADTEGRVLSSHLMSNADYVSLTEFGRQHHVPFGVQDASGQVYTADHDIDYITALQAVENHCSIRVRRPDAMPVDFAIAKADFVGDPALLDKVEPFVRAKYGDELYITRAGRVFIELMNKDVSKGRALAELVRRLGYSADEVMAIGDEENDLPLLKFAGTAVAMGNGLDTVKAAADHVTDDIAHDGWAHAVRKYALS
ncbi:Cof-type HAD-IIB family hydrolase [Lacticaseibacillus zhaodongensis]|uniref:Cof-type HAD-IIB family hydrolase n=1 Tax=Lacticaseibacillus zhaodongensis TaxID=2668065 RepID=UPI001E29F566|nr:Cof-type HAD-IIB family hydrolase [Lacticaseibacillus zhaodongensis]